MIISRFAKDKRKSLSSLDERRSSSKEPYAFPNTGKYLTQTRKLVNIGNIAIDTQALKNRVNNKLMMSMNLNNSS